MLVAAAVRLPGHGGHSPLEGLGAEPIRPIELASILPAALATLGLGLVLGPEAPLIALVGVLLNLLATAAAFLITYYGPRLVARPWLRAVVIVMFVGGFAAAVVGGGFGAFLNKVAPIV